VMAAMSLMSCQTSAAPHGTDMEHHKSHDEPTPYDAKADAWADVRVAKERAKISGKKTIVAMGANWCHDSRGLAAQFDKLRFQILLNAHFELVYVDVGQKDRNIDMAQEFGVNDIVGTPTVFILSSKGDVLNLETAPTWRNAASRSEDEIFDYFRSFAHPKREN